MIFRRTNYPIRAETVEVLARAFHDVYLSAPGPGSNSSAVSWEELPETFKESNRDLARHVGSMAHAIGCALEPGGADGACLELRADEVERLARSEHQRWRRQMRRSGWRWAAGPKNAQTLTSPDLVPWSRLSEQARELDRRMVRALPQVLGAAGLRLARADVRRRPKSARRGGVAAGLPSERAVPASASGCQEDTSVPAAVRAARKLLSEHRRLEFSEVVALVAGLQSAREWSLARQVLQAAASGDLDAPARRRLRQLMAVCTYKDTELRLLPALEAGLAALTGDEEDLSSSRDCETLAIAGAIHKRMWEVSGTSEHLGIALGYYLRGMACADGADSGYTAVNAAFLHDLLADLDERTARQTGLPSQEAERHRDRAVALRAEVLRRHGADAWAAVQRADAGSWWLIATVAEAAFGTGDYLTAARLLAGARDLPGLPDWQLESTAAQLVALAHLRTRGEGSPPKAAQQIVADLMGWRLEELTGLAGRVGLALSGGGFRASFFHLGVLARLAELDVLRHVEVLSCVSGGSIVGAHYYLELRRRMQRRADAEMTREEYIDIVRTVQRDFVAATQRNIRRRALTNPVALLKTMLLPGYNRTAQVARMLDRYFYRPALDGADPVLGDLGITPVEGPHPFDPRRHNWRRRAKVPLLIINATSLNTGHNWQFTTNWMGEPYAFIDDRTDANYRLGRVSLAADGGWGGRESLGRAVAASACVPGLLAPLHLDGVYPGKSVRLVDGGVHDNQGVYGLLEEDCSYLLVSDASGQMNADDSPADHAFATLRRSNAILMATVRNTFFTELDALRRSGRLRGLLYLHLKRDLCADVVSADQAAGPTHHGPDTGVTSYGMPRPVQRHIAGLRTDLNVFSRAQVCALMLSGYRMTAAAFPTDLPAFPANSQPPVPWDFQVIAPAVDARPGSSQAEALARLLGMGRHRT